MNDRTRNAFADYGLEILKRSVLLVLYEEHISDDSYRKDLQPTKIREKLGIPRQADGQNPLIRSILNILGEYVEPHSYRTGCWQITEKGISLIEGEHQDSD